MADSSTGASSRLPLTPKSHERMKEFRNGLGGSFDEAIEVLLDSALKSGEDEYSAGKRLKSRLEKLKKAVGD